MKWDLNECIREVSQLADGSYVNFSQLARKNHVCNANGDILKNGGQIVKEVLIENNVDINRFEYLGKATTQDFVAKK